MRAIGHWTPSAGFAAALALGCGGAQPVPSAPSPTTGPSQPCSTLPRAELEPSIEQSSSAVVHPIARVKPVYPQEPHDEGVEGWVELRFTVTRAGRVCDVEVVRADPPGAFDQSAVRSVVQWRYRAPETDSGRQVAARGVTTRVTYSISDPGPPGTRPRPAATGSRWKGLNEQLRSLER